MPSPPHLHGVLTSPHGVTSSAHQNPEIHDHAGRRRRHSLIVQDVDSELLTTLFAGLYSPGTLSGRLRNSFTRLGDRQFHLLVPATASHLNLCKLLISAAVEGYPDPIILGWNGHGVYNGAESHTVQDLGD